MTLSLKTSAFGQKVTLKVTVAAATKGAGKPTGTVTFEDNGVARRERVTLKKGKAYASRSRPCRPAATRLPRFTMAATLLRSQHVGCRYAMW